MGRQLRGQLAKFVAVSAIIVACVPTTISVTANAAGTTPTGNFPAVLAAPAPAPTAAHPTRILSLSASATQMLYAIGAGRQVVGVDKYSTYPPDAPRTKFTGDESSAEDYLPLKPDLVIFAYKTAVVQQLKLLGIPSLVLPPANTMADVYSQIAELGAATGHVKTASAVKASVATHIATAVRDAHGAGRGDTYYVELDPTYYTATAKTFIGAEFSLFGMRDIASAPGDGYPQIQAEYILKKDPDYVFLADTVCCHQTSGSFANRPGFSILRAVKLHHVIGVNDSVASQWGPHTIELFVSLMARTLGP
jgi:iron complex transport system substrate-binding protein